MSSGIYSALSGNIARMQAMESLTNNLANANTAGYKKDRLAFASMLGDATQVQAGKGINFTRLQDSFIDFSQGPIYPTGADFDFAIQGEGFFKVKKEDAFFYTRQGQFHLGADGTLLTASDLEVVNESNQPIKVTGPGVTVDEEGRMLDASGAEVGRLSLFSVDDLKLLTKGGEGLFSLPAGIQDQVVAKPQVIQGRLEGSNVNTVEEMALMMEGLRAFESYQKMIKTYGTIDSKADELGSL